MNAAAGSRPNVLVLGLGWFPDQTGGLNRYVRDTVTRLEGEVTTVVIGSASDAPASVHAVSRHDAPVLRRVWAYARAARAAAPAADVVDAHFALYAALPLLTRSVRRLPLVVHFHGPWADEARRQRSGPGWSAAVGYRARRAVERWVYRRADRIVVLSDAFAELVSTYGVPRERIVVIPPGVDLARFRPGDREAARSALGIPNAAWVAVSARRLVPRTGIDVLLAAWSHLCRDTGGVAISGREARLLIVGDGPCRLELEAAACRNGGTVRFLGRISDEDLVAAYQAADVSVVPSHALEGFGLVVAESLACGTPAVVSDVGGLPGAVAGLGGELVVSAGDSFALAARLRDAIDETRPLPDPIDCRAFAERYDLEHAVGRLRRLYATLVVEGAERPRVVVLDHTARLSGGEIAMLRLVEALQRSPGADGADVTVLCFEDGPLVGQLRAVGVQTQVLPLAARVRELDRRRVVPGRVPLAALAGAAIHTIQLARWLRRHRPDIVHANSLKAGVIGGIAARLAGVPLIWHVRDRLADDYLPAFTAHALRWWIPRVSAAVVANSQSTMEVLAPPPGTLAVVVPSPYRAPAVVRDPRSQGGPMRVGMVGRMAPWKGQLVFLDAFARAFPTGGAVAVVAGAALFGESDYEASQHARARELGIGDRVEFAGFVDDVPGLLAGLDVLVHASVIPEPHGQVVVEGMAAGLAVVASAAGGPAEIVTDGVDGLLVAPGDVDALADALRHLARDPDLRARLGEAAVRRAADFDPDQVVPVLHDVYARVSGRRRCRR